MKVIINLSKKCDILKFSIEYQEQDRDYFFETSDYNDHKRKVIQFLEDSFSISIPEDFRRAQKRSFKIQDNILSTLVKIKSNQNQFKADFPHDELEFHNNTRNAYEWGAYRYVNVSNLDHLISLARDNDAKNKGLLTFPDFKRVFNDSMDSIKESTQITDEKKAVFKHFSDFLDAYQGEMPDRKELVRQWIKAYQKDKNQNPFDILNKQRRNLDFISSLPFLGKAAAEFFTPNLTNSTKLFLKFAGDAKDLKDLGITSKNTP